MDTLTDSKVISALNKRNGSRSIASLISELENNQKAIFQTWNNRIPVGQAIPEDGVTWQAASRPGTQQAVPITPGQAAPETNKQPNNASAKPGDRTIEVGTPRSQLPAGAEWGPNSSGYHYDLEGNRIREVYDPARNEWVLRNFGPTLEGLKAISDLQTKSPGKDARVVQAELDKIYSDIEISRDTLAVLKNKQAFDQRRDIFALNNDDKRLHQSLQDSIQNRNVQLANLDLSLREQEQSRDNLLAQMQQARDQLQTELQYRSSAANVTAQNEASQFNARMGFDVQQANALAEQARTTELRALSASIADAARDPGDRARLASLLLANSGWGQSLPVGIDTRTTESLAPTESLLRTRRDVLSRPISPYTFQNYIPALTTAPTIAQPSLPALRLSGATTKAIATGAVMPTELPKIPLRDLGQLPSTMFDNTARDWVPPASPGYGYGVDNGNGVDTSPLRPAAETNLIFKNPDTGVIMDVDSNHGTYAHGGATRDKMFMVGDSKSGRPTGYEEIIVNPTRAPIRVIPRYAEGTQVPWQQGTGPALERGFSNLPEVKNYGQMLGWLMSKGVNQEQAMGMILASIRSDMKPAANGPISELLTPQAPAAPQFVAPAAPQFTAPPAPVASGAGFSVIEPPPADGGSGYYSEEVDYGTPPAPVAPGAGFSVIEPPPADGGTGWMPSVADMEQYHKPPQSPEREFADRKMQFDQDFVDLKSGNITGQIYEERNADLDQSEFDLYGRLKNMSPERALAFIGVSGLAGFAAHKFEKSRNSLRMQQQYYQTPTARPTWQPNYDSLISTQFQKPQYTINPAFYSSVDLDNLKHYAEGTGVFNQFGNIDDTDRSLANEFLRRSSEIGRSNTPWQTGPLPQPVFASSPGFNPYVTGIIGALMAQEQGIPADYFASEATRYRPMGMRETNIGRTG